MGVAEAASSIRHLPRSRMARSRPSSRLGLAFGLPAGARRAWWTSSTTTTSHPGPSSRAWSWSRRRARCDEASSSFEDCQTLPSIGVADPSSPTSARLARSRRGTFSSSFSASSSCHWIITDAGTSTSAVSARPDSTSSRRARPISMVLPSPTSSASRCDLG